MSIGICRSAVAFGQNVIEFTPYSHTFSFSVAFKGGGGSDNHSLNKSPCPTPKDVFLYHVPFS